MPARTTALDAAVAVLVALAVASALWLVLS